MKIKLDENIPEELVEPLRRLGHDADSVRQEGLSGEQDPSVWSAAQREGRLLVTQDLYFGDIRSHLPGTHAGILLLRLPQTGRRQVIDRVTEIFETQDASVWVGCNVVANENHVRVRMPDGK